MGLGYTTILYDNESVETGLGDIAACQYDGVEIGLPKLLDADPDNVEVWLDRYDLDLYCVMSAWLENETAVDNVCDNAELVAELGAEFLRGEIDRHRISNHASTSPPRSDSGE